MIFVCVKKLKLDFANLNCLNHNLLIFISPSSPGSICDALDIPHLEARLQDLGERDISRELSVNLHPGSLAISESLRELIIYLNWTKVAIIYQDDMCK